MTSLTHSMYDGKGMFFADNISTVCLEFCYMSTTIDGHYFLKISKVVFSGVFADSY